MESQVAVTPLDGVVLVLLALALIRGTIIGLIRESFSIAAVAVAVLAARYGTPIATDWLVAATDNLLGQLTPWVAGAVIAITALLAVAVLGRILRRGIRFAGLSWADRLGGAAFGFGEGALISLLAVLGAVTVLGRSHPWIQDSYSVKVYDEASDQITRRAHPLPAIEWPFSTR